MCRTHQLSLKKEECDMYHALRGRMVGSVGTPLPCRNPDIHSLLHRPQQTLPMLLAVSHLVNISSRTDGASGCCTPLHGASSCSPHWRQWLRHTTGISSCCPPLTPAAAPHHWRQRLLPTTVTSCCCPPLAPVAAAHHGRQWLRPTTSVSGCCRSRYEARDVLSSLLS